jgi:putative membrane protein
MNRTIVPAILALAVGILVLSPYANAQAPTDPQIVGIVVAANNIDIDAGKLALTKAKDPDVRKFAQLMITDHSAVQKSVFALGAKLHVAPADSGIADSLKKQAAETAAHLKTLSGAAFDKAYVDNEVAYHQAVIDAIDKVLIPNAQNAELKSTLVSTAPAFVAHLEHAKQLQSQLAGGPAAGHAH